MANVYDALGWFSEDRTMTNKEKWARDYCSECSHEECSVNRCPVRKAWIAGFDKAYEYATNPLRFAEKEIETGNVPDEK